MNNYSKDTESIEAPKIVTEIPGPESRRLFKKQKELETNSVIYPASFPIAIKRAYGSITEDVDGNRYIDWQSGVCVMNLGFTDPVKSAIENQLNEIWHLIELPSEVRIKFLEELRNSFPISMRDYKSVFGISGSDACEAAINIAHTFHKGKHPTTIAFEGAYHGVSGGIISATSAKKYKEVHFSQGFDIIRAPYPYKLRYDYDVSDIVSIIRNRIIDPESGYERPDSLIVEPIQGEGGYVVPPIEFLKGLRELCDEFDMTMIVDEIQSGLGRTGKMWAFEWSSIEPDIVCIGKSIGGGIPISVIYFRNDYDKALPRAFHLGTYRGNPLALAAGRVVLKEVPNYFERVIRDGESLKDKFQKIDSKLVREVRGRGFMIGLELCRGDTPLSSEDMTNIKLNLLKNGLLMHSCGRFSNVLRFMAPLNTDSSLLNKGSEILAKVLKTTK